MTDQYNNHKIFLLVGPSGAGKSVVLNGVIEKITKVKRLPSYTTRAKRKAEQEGREHFFVTVDTFRQLIKDGKLLEYVEVYPGMFYGVPLEKAKDLLRKNNLIKDIEIFGEKSLKRAFPQNSISIFIKPPNLKVLEKRLRRRGNMSEKEIKERLQRVSMEMEESQRMDYCVINDELEKCIDQVVEIIKKEIY